MLKLIGDILGLLCMTEGPLISLLQEAELLLGAQELQVLVSKLTVPFLEVLANLLEPLLKVNFHLLQVGCCFGIELRTIRVRNIILITKLKTVWPGSPLVHSLRSCISP